MERPVPISNPTITSTSPPDPSDTRSEADGMAVSQDGWLLVATAMGIQICDMPGRVHFIMSRLRWAPVIPSNVAFHGNTLYATCGDKVFQTQSQTPGSGNPGPHPSNHAKPRL